MGSYRTYLIPGKTAALLPKFAVEDLPWAQHTDDYVRCLNYI